MHHFYRGIRAKIERTIFHNVSGGENSRKRFLLNANPWKGLIVFQQDIVAWLVLLDEVVLQQQRIKLRLNYNVLDVVNFPNQKSGFTTVISILGEVGPHPLSQIFCLAYIDEIALRVEVLIHARIARQRLQ